MSCIGNGCGGTYILHQLTRSETLLTIGVGILMAITLYLIIKENDEKQPLAPKDNKEMP